MSYTAGWNMPGYLPEMEPATFDTVKDAIEYLKDEIQRNWDSSYEYESPEPAVLDSQYAPVIRDLESLLKDKGEIVSWYSEPLNSYVYWFEQDSQRLSVADFNFGSNVILP